MADRLDCALDIMRRLPPQNVEDNVAGLLDIAPDLTEDILSAVDQPLKVNKCKVTGKDYLLCDYNRDGDSYRSPWSNQYSPALDDGTVPSDSLRKLEIQANDAFDTYREMYFEGGVSSVYMWDLDHGFAAAILIKKVGEGSKKMRGAWDSIHVVEVINSGKTSTYKLTSTVMLYMKTNKPGHGEMNLSGSMTRQSEVNNQVVDDAHPHVANIGHMVEDMEIKMRTSLQEIYFGKTKDIVNALRSLRPLSETKAQQDVANELMAKLSKRN